MIATSTPPSSLTAALAVARCRAAQQTWAARSVADRLRPVAALRALLADEADRLCEAVGRDLGKPPDEALAADVLPTADACRFLQREAERLLRPRRVPGRLRPLWLWGQSDTVHRRPRGVVGLIGTWNYPVFLNGVALVQALTAGNGVVWKPSEVAPASAAVLGDLVRRAGYPEDLVVRLPATREAGRDLADADVDHVCFTGSSATGRALAVSLAQRLIPSTLELSGCDAMFVLADADPAFAARAAWFGSTINRGQTCIAVRRAFVHRSRYDAFVASLRPLVEASGPMELAMPAQAGHADRLVAGAVADGATVLRGTGPGCVPRVVVGARPEMAVCQEASFAPILAVLPFDTLDEALAMDHACPYALGASVFTADADAATAWAGRLRTGSVTVNDVVVSTAHPATPFGGSGESGWGVTQGAEGLLELTIPQVVSVRGGTFRPHYDLAAGQQEMARGLLEAGHAPTLGRRLRGWLRLLRAMRK